MARSLRIDFAGARHHVMNRGARKQRIFFHSGDRAYFLALVAELPERFGVEVHGYALMPNHFHLMLRCPLGNLGVAMRWLQQVWTQAVNRRHGWDGALFRGRFRNCVADSEVYWGHLLAYLHLNPVRSGHVSSVDDSGWTSHRAFVGTAPLPSWLTTLEMMNWYGTVGNYREYLEDLRAGRRGEPEGFSLFASWDRQSAVATPIHRRSPPKMSAADAAELVRTITGRPWHDTDNTPGEPNPHAAFSAWVMNRTGALTQGEIARASGVSRPAVTKRIESFVSRHQGDPMLWTWTSQLDAALFERLRLRRLRVA